MILHVVIIKWKTIKNNIQTTNKKRRQRIEIERGYVPFHVGYTGHRPLRKITIEQICFIKRCSNHSRTRIQQRKTKRQRTNTKKEKENWK